jgi:hypothetical protein
MKIHYAVNYYNPEQKDRRKEINKCLRGNIKLEEIDKIHLLVGPGVKIPKWAKIPKVKIVKIDIGRATYGQFFEYAKRLTGIFVIANADILCTPSIAKLEEYVNADQCVCLKRHDFCKREKKWKMFKRNNDSQDLWAVMAPPKEIPGDIDFQLGIPGCDNQIAYLLLKAYKARNPATKIIIKHEHHSDVRNYLNRRLRARIGRINIE